MNSRNYIKKAVGTLALVLMAFGGFAQDLPNLDWLMGEWHLKEFGSFERWTKVDGGYDGVGYRISGGEEKVWEELKLQQIEGKWTLSVSQKGSTTIDFPLIAVEGNKMTFENPEHDFPTRITYWESETGPMAIVEGTMGADETTMTFTFERPTAEIKDAQTANDDAMSAANSPLGSFGVITMGVKDLAISSAFYESLGFELKAADNFPYPWARLSDGGVMVHLNQDGFEYIGMTYYTEDMASVKTLATKNGLTSFMDEESPVPFVVYLDPDTTFGLSIVGMPDETKPMPTKSEGALGTFGELAIPVSDFAAAAVWYESMGYKKLSEYDSPYKWGLFTDGIVIIGLHQSDHFDKPSLTYFSMEAEAKIVELQEKGMKVKNAMPDTKQKKLKYGVVESPDGWPVNVFHGDF